MRSKSSSRTKHDRSSEVAGIADRRDREFDDALATGAKDAFETQPDRYRTPIRWPFESALHPRRRATAVPHGCYDRGGRAAGRQDCRTAPAKTACADPALLFLLFYQVEIRHSQLLKNKRPCSRGADLATIGCDYGDSSVADAAIQMKAAMQAALRHI
jgi:hypothetical protein